MKRFNELTKEQQREAVNFALGEIKSCMELGLIKFGNIVNKSHLEEYARIAAEDAYYTEEGDTVIDAIAGGK